MAKETPWRLQVDKVVGKAGSYHPISSIPLVTSVLISSEPSGQVEGAVGGQPRVHPLGKVEDLGWRKRFPIALLPLEPALAATCRTLLPTSGEEEVKVEEEIQKYWYGCTSSTS